MRESLFVRTLRRGQKVASQKSWKWLATGLRRSLPKLFGKTRLNRSEPSTLPQQR